MTPQGSTTLAVQVASISISLIASGGIAALSVFDVPELQAQPASRSLPTVRWLFSRGSHIFPSAAFISSAGFVYLAVNALPPARAGTETIRMIPKLFHMATNGRRVNGFLAAAALSLSIGPITSKLMIPTNFALIKLNADLGGARSQRAARRSGGGRGSSRSAEDSVAGIGEDAEFTDLSGPQSRTDIESSPEQDEEVMELLTKFGRLNAVRGVMLGLGGIVALCVSLS